MSMHWEWAGRWGGAACAVAGCMPMLATFVAGLSGAAGAGAAAAASGMGMGMVAGTGPVVPGWVTALGSVSWPLLLVSAALLVASFWRTPPRPRAVAYLGVAVLLANQLHMRTWLFFPGMALVGAGFAMAWASRLRAAAPRPGAQGLGGL